MSPGGPGTLPPDRVTALARELDRQGRKLTAVDDAVAMLAEDVKTLVARAGPVESGPPLSWLLESDPDRAAMILDDLCKWLNEVYLWYPRAALPSCWLWHPPLIEELWWLRQAHAEAYGAAIRTVTRVADWHERHLPGVVVRIQAAYGDCELARHAADTSGDRRGRIPDLPMWAAAERIADAWVTRSIPDPTSGELTQAQVYDDEVSKRQ